MKHITTFLTGSIFLLLFAMNVNGQWAYNGTHIYNTNAGNVGISTNAPGKLFDVAKNMTEPVIRVYNLGGAGGASFEMQDVASGADWKFKATNLGGFKIRDNAKALDVITIEQNSLANAFYIKQGGNVGIGTNNPLEKLDVNGAVRIGNTATNNSGTIRFDGFNFLGFDGASWLQLDNPTVSPTWIMIPNPMPAPQNNPQLYPALPPSTVTTTLPGSPNNTAWIYATDIPAPGLYPHQLSLEAMVAAGGTSASQLYQISLAPMQPLINFSAGINNMDMTYKVNVGPVLIPTVQSDGQSALRAFPSGIVDLPNQSRVRAYQMDPNGFVQAIPPNIWVPINFTNISPLPSGYDEQSEFAIAAGANVAVPPEQAYFTAIAEGYYQVNARCEFEYSQQVNPGSYVSIAIYTGPAPGATFSYARGNNLQMGTIGAGGEPYQLINNNAPNVSDVVYLMPGQIISIWVFQSTLAPMNLIQGPDRCYVSIHKVS